MNPREIIPVPFFDFRFSHFVLTPLALFLLALVACGSPTAPTPPSRHIPLPAASLAARQIGEEVVLSFMLPQRTTDGKPVGRNLQIFFYREFRKKELLAPEGGETPQAGGEELAQELFGEARPVKEWSGEELERLATGHAMQYPDRISVEDLQAHSGEWAVYGVLARNRKGRSAGFSNLIAVRVYPAPAPPGNVIARNAEAGVELIWSAPSQTTSGTPITSLGPFHIYRSRPAAAGKPGEKEEWELVGETETSPWTDTRVEYGQTYRYEVRAVAQYGTDSIESDASAVISITPQDVFPPKSPEGLIAVPILAAYGGPAIELSWQPNAESDLAGYNIYRRELPKPSPGEVGAGDGAGYRKLNATLILGPAYRDDTVELGKNYFYRVTAVDRAGNESNPSAEISAGVPAEPQPPESSGARSPAKQS